MTCALFSRPVTRRFPLLPHVSNCQLEYRPSFYIGKAITGRLQLSTPWMEARKFDALRRINQPDGSLSWAEKVEQYAGSRQLLSIAMVKPHVKNSREKAMPSDL